MKVRWLPYEIADGPANMAADEVMLEFAKTEHIAALRFYGWEPATLSLGYFQLSSDRLQFPDLPWVRRATGGSALVHDNEVTYALTLPPEYSSRNTESWIGRMHRIIASAISNIGIGVPMSIVEAPKTLGDVLCFQKHTMGDLICRSEKIAGSAQRKQHRCLLQHGGILLSQSRYAPQLPGLAELCDRTIVRDQLVDAIVRAFAQDTGWELQDSRWTAAEQQQRARLAQEKYSCKTWNERR